MPYDHDQVQAQIDDPHAWDRYLAERPDEVFKMGGAATHCVYAQYLTHLTGLPASVGFTFGSVYQDDRENDVFEAAAWVGRYVRGLLHRTDYGTVTGAEAREALRAFLPAEGE